MRNKSKMLSSVDQSQQENCPVHQFLAKLNLFLVNSDY